MWGTDGAESARDETQEVEGKPQVKIPGENLGQSRILEPEPALEIWTDVPGMFTANPHLVSNARLLRNLTYEEAEAIARTGAKVLHPRCIAPAKKSGIPIFVRCTSNPEIPGTVICAQDKGKNALRLCALTARTGLTLLSTGMNHRDPMGVLTKMAEHIGNRDLHIDSFVANNHHIQTVIDPLLSPIDDQEMRAFLNEFDQFNESEVTTDVSSLSLVGRGTDELYEGLGAAMADLGCGRLRHLGSTGSMDVTLFLEHDGIDDLVSAVHGRILEKSASCETFGPTWRELREEIHAMEPAWA